GCDPLSQTQRSRLQHRRARINQQINKEMRMRAGAENLFRATSNNKVRETVALELSFVNSNLQLLKEELEDEAVHVPMIPLGLKETKDVDFTVPLQDFILEHYGEEVSLYDGEIKELTELRQAMRTPSRTQEGLELLMEYYNQLFYLDQRFFRALAFEKGSVLFNLGSLHTQMGARQDRAFNYLKDNFSNAPSLDMSGPSLGMLVRLMVAQVQECVFERVTLATRDATFTSLLRLAQEAAQVSEVYSLAQQTMSQPPVENYVPFPWLSTVQVKAEHFSALSHYYTATALCDHARKAHLRRAVMRHEEAMRVHGLCKVLRKMDILQDVLALTHRRSLDKYSGLDREDDFHETSEAPDIQPQTQQKPDVTPPDFTAVQVTDIFQRLGPLSVFNARARLGPERRVCLQRGEGGLGLTLRGDSPVLVAGVLPGGCAAQLSQGDKENTRQRLLIGGNKGQSSASLLNWHRKKKREGGGASRRLGSTFSLSLGSLRDTESMY
ncbi:hypothetical protein NHX12_033708, partial [Muraenolepis orangiensis]